MAHPIQLMTIDFGIPAYPGWSDAPSFFVGPGFVSQGVDSKGTSCYFTVIS